MREESRSGGRFDPLLVGVVAAGVYALHGYDGALNHDLGVFVYGGIQVADGTPPYAGIFNSVGPLADLVPGLAIWIGDHLRLDPVLAARLFFTAIAALATAWIAVLGRAVLGSRGAGLTAAAVFLTFEEFLELASSGPREKTTMILFLVLALLHLVRGRWLAAGCCTALATLTWQPVLAVALAAAVVLLLGADHRGRAALRFVLGGAIPVAAAVGYFAAHGALRDAVNGFLVVNLDSTQQSLLVDPRHTLTFLWRGYHLSLVLVPVGLVALALVAATRRTRPLLALAGGAVAGVAWTTYAVNGPPDLFVLLPFAAVGLAGAVVALADRLEPNAGLAAVALTTVVCVNVAVIEAVHTESDSLEAQRANVRAVLAAAPADATVLSLDAPQVLALADRRNPSSYQLFNANMQRFLDSTLPGGVSGYAATVVAERPTLIAAPATGLPSWARPELRDDYRYAGRGPDWTWWIARSSGRTAAADVRDANRVARDGTPLIG